MARRRRHVGARIKEPAKTLLFPEQVKITCTNSDKTCQELKVTLGPMGGLVFIAGIDETTWLDTSTLDPIRLKLERIPSCRD
jgi:hypothetical protein